MVVFIFILRPTDFVKKKIYETKSNTEFLLNCTCLETAADNGTCCVV